MSRIEEICKRIAPCKTFADVGCDHGFCTRYALEQKLCEIAYVTDISARSLEKAKTLLKSDIRAGRCVPVVADGLDGVAPCEQVLIAGMGGEEIVRILSRVPLPDRFILQPMKNAEKVRAFLLARGAHIEEDVTFADKKFYDLIVGTAAGGDEYSVHELRFGRDNLKRRGAGFLGKIRHDAAELRTALSAADLTGRRREEVLERLDEIEVILNAIEDGI